MGVVGKERQAPTLKAKVRQLGRVLRAGRRVKVAVVPASPAIPIGLIRCGLVVALLRDGRGYVPHCLLSFLRLKLEERLANDCAS